MLFGLLGPEATSITYRDHGKLRKQAITETEGAYLIVLAVAAEEQRLLASARCPPSASLLSASIIAMRRAAAAGVTGTRPNVRWWATRPDQSRADVAAHSGSASPGIAWRSRSRPGSRCATRAASTP